MSTRIITETSTYTSLCLSPVPLPLALTLPNELWLQVLRSAVSTKEWREDVFFPPKIDFSLIDGFRQTCHLFHDLSVSLYQSMRGRNVTVNDAFDLLRPSFPLERTKHVAVEREMKPADFFLLMPRVPNLESLSVSFQVSSLGSTILLSHENLTRLDLSFSTVFGTNVLLDFPNLEELRLSRSPTSRCQSDVPMSLVYVMQPLLDNLTRSLRNLKKLRHISLHGTITGLSTLVELSRIHESEHGDNSHVHFSECLQCMETDLFKSRKQEECAMEKRLTNAIAAHLPTLESVSWTDGWRKEFEDEKAQRVTLVTRDSKTTESTEDDLTSLRAAMYEYLKLFDTESNMDSDEFDDEDDDY